MGYRHCWLYDYAAASAAAGGSLCAGAPVLSPHWWPVSGLRAVRLPPPACTLAPPPSDGTTRRPPHAPSGLCAHRWWDSGPDGGARTWHAASPDAASAWGDIAILGAGPGIPPAAASGEPAHGDRLPGRPPQ